MRRLLIAASLLTLGACQPAAAQPSPTPSPTACRLPLGVQGAQSGFVAYPGGAFTPDPSSDPTLSPYRGLNGSSIGFGPTYDRQQGRWLPVPRALVAPDGSTYAYAELVFPTPGNPAGPTFPNGTRIHVVNVASATDRVLLDTTEFWEVLAYTGSELYLDRPCLECGVGSRGLWAMDASTSAIKQLTPPVDDASSGWRLVSSGAAWSSDGQGALSRLDLTTGTITVWLSIKGKSLRPIGLDSSGHPIVEGEADYQTPGSSRGGAWVVTAPHQSIRIAPDDVIIEDAVSDAHGTWLLTLDTVLLWNPKSGLNQVGTLPPTTHAKSLAGTCA